jgi:hypothetical protein
MRLRDNEIDLVAKHIVTKLVNGGHVDLEGVGEAELQEHIKGAIAADLSVEDNLNREVEDILRAHMKDAQSQSIDYRKMFSMVKNKLARERNIILS